MNELRIGVLGCANIAERSVIPAIESTPGYELVAVASRTKEKANSFADKFGCEAVAGYRNLIDRDDLDVIYIPLPTGLHEEWVIAALNAGKHVYVEKSLATTYGSAKKMVEKAKEKKLLIMENFMFPYHQQTSFVKKMLEDNIIGDLRSFRSTFSFPLLPADNFRYNKSLGGGVLMDAAAYTLKASQVFLGDGLLVIASTLNMLEAYEVDMYGSAYLRTEAGVVSQVNFGFDSFYQCNYELLGNKGKITAHRAFTAGPGIEPVITVENQSGSVDHAVKSDNHFVNILLELRRTLESGDYSQKYQEVLNQSRLLQGVLDNASTSITK